jgi:hypothetical protein
MPEKLDDKIQAEARKLVKIGEITQAIAGCSKEYSKFPPNFLIKQIKELMDTKWTEERIRESVTLLNDYHLGIEANRLMLFYNSVRKTAGYESVEF